MYSVRSRIRVDSKYMILFVFVIALFVRGLPELLSGPYPVGYDLLAGYAPSIQALPETYPLKLFGWFGSPLSVFILWFFWKISQANLFLFLKIAGPVFYGLFVASFFYMLYKGLEWDRKKSYFTALLFLLQPAVLRTGWDQLRLMLGFVFLFVLLAKTKCDIVSATRNKPFSIVVLSVLIVVSQQLTAVLFFVVALWQLVKSRRERSVLLKALLVLFPSAIVFMLQLYLAYFVDAGFSNHLVPVTLPSGSGFFAFTNYFLSEPTFLGGSYLTVLAYVSNLSLYTVIPLVPLAAKGFLRDRVFMPMLAWLLITSYSVVVFPWFAFSYFWWWIFLLPIPLTVYAGHALERLGVLAEGKQSKRLMIGFLLLGVVALGYASSAISVGYPYAYHYMPPGLVKSCADFSDISDIKEAFNWVNAHIPLNAMLVVPWNFQGFASMYSRSDLQIRVAQDFLSFDSAISLVENKSGSLYALYLERDLKDSNYTVETLMEFGNVGIYRVIL